MGNLIEVFEETEPVYSIIKETLSMFDNYWTKRHKDVITKFHRQILDGNATDDKIEYEKEYIKAEPDDYFTLLKYVVNDDEKEKVGIYSNIYKYIRKNQSLEQTDKIKIIRIAKELTFSALKLIPELHMKKHCNEQNFNLEKYLSDFNFNELITFEKNQLIQCGLLQTNKQDVITAPSLYISTNFDLYANAFFNLK